MEDGAREAQELGAGKEQEAEEADGEPCEGDPKSGSMLSEDRRLRRVRSA